MSSSLGMLSAMKGRNKCWMFDNYQQPALAFQNGVGVFALPSASCWNTSILQSCHCKNSIKIFVSDRLDICQVVTISYFCKFPGSGAHGICSLLSRARYD